MCYSCHLITPLTLSEIRAMLPGPASASPLPVAQAVPLLGLLLEARSALTLSVGACACAFVPALQGLDLRSQERALRARYRSLALGREQVIRYLERHRTGEGLRRADGTDWPRRFHAFAVEHARNAGPSVYLLQFADSPHGPARVHCTLANHQRPETWLQEGLVIEASS